MWTTLALTAALLFLSRTLWNKSSTFKYYVKNSFFYVVVVLAATASCFYGVVRPKHPYNLIPICATIVTTRWLLGLTMETRNGERLKSDKPFILVANHQSGLDMISMSWLLPDRCVALIKKELMYMAQFGLSAYLCGSIFIDRSNSEKARKTMDNAVQEILKKNLKVWVFPEGTRGREDGMLPFKKGGFHLAVQAQIPVVPVAISTYRPFFIKKEKRFDSGKIIMSVLPPIPTVGLTSDDVSDLTEKVREQMMAEYDRLKVEVEDYCLNLNGKKNV